MLLSSVRFLSRPSITSTLKFHPTAAFIRMASTTVSSPPIYPKARRDEEHVEVYKSKKEGEVKVKDPYHWLESPPSESAETKAWVDAQVTLTNQHLALNPDRKKYRAELEKNWDYAKISVPVLKRDGNYYVSFNSGLQNQSPTYRFPQSELETYKSAEGPPGELFFDPNLLSTDGTISLSTTAFSHTGKLWAYGLSKSGSDWYTVHVRSTTAPFVGVDDASKLADELAFVKFSSLTWTHDDKGFFYQRFPEVIAKEGDTDLGTATASDKDAQVFYHRIGTPQSADLLIHSDPSNPQHMFGFGITTDGKYAILSTSRDTAQSALLSIAELGDGGKDGETYQSLKWKSIVGEWGSLYSVIDNNGSKFTVQTNKDAPNWKVQTFDLAADEITFNTIIEEDQNAVLGSVSPIREDLLVVTYCRDVNDELYLYSNEGKRIVRLAPNYVGSIGSISGRKEHDRFFVSTSGYTNPGSVSVVDLSKNIKVESADLELLKSTKMSLKDSDFITVQEFYESKDGTRIPVIITRHKDVKLDGSAPLLLYGYGGFNIGLTPRFSPSWMTWVKAYRGVLAVPNLRGGDEYGEKWHEGGIKEKKQNTFDDFLYAADHLIAQGYTSAGKIIFNGGSNGGLLVAACTNQARDGLIGASIADVGVMDLLKFHRWTIGHYWVSDYGNPDDPNDFDFIYPISPLHNVNPIKTYPPFLITTADHDDRVVPAHSFKLAATLQHDRADNKNPLLIRIDVKAGHGAGKPTAKVIDEAVDKWGWASHTLGLKMHDD